VYVAQLNSSARPHISLCTQQTTSGTPRQLVEPSLLSSLYQPQKANKTSCPFTFIRTCTPTLSRHEGKQCQQRARLLLVLAYFVPLHFQRRCSSPTRIRPYKRLNAVFLQRSNNGGKLTARSDPDRPTQTVSASTWKPTRRYYNYRVLPKSTCHWPDLCCLRSCFVSNCD
jgi:hypothetical protein